MYYPRSLNHKLTEALKYFPVVAVTGARQVGKSTWLQNQLGHQFKTFVFDPLIDIGNARQDPELFLRSQVSPLILDEIQYVPQLVPVLKRLVDEKKVPGLYILTGSQQWEVMKSLAESLAGRVAFIDLEGFSLAESSHCASSQSWLDEWMKNQQSGNWQRLQMPLSVFEQIWRGWFPAVQFLPQSQVSTFYTGYLRTYIERDARQLADISDWEIFGRFVRLCAALTSQEMNASQFGRDIGITPQTAQRWLQILKATFQWYEVPAFSMNATQRLSQKSKGYFAESGFACFCQSISSPEALSGHPLWGAIFEMAVFAELRKQMALMDAPPAIYHWRTHGGAEVDFILERDGWYFPIEVKAKSHPSRKDLSGIHAFRKSYPHLKIAPGLIIAPVGEFAALSSQDYVMPWDALSKTHFVQ